MRTFHYDWFQPNEAPIAEALKPLVGLPVHGLEIGSFEGRSTCWFFDNVLTHHDAKLTCVDHFKGGSDQAELDVKGLYGRFLTNTSEFHSRMFIVVDDSWRAWPQLAEYAYDFVFVDGSHEKWDVLHDAVEAFRVTKLLGFIIFDDYHWRPELESRPAVAIDAFLSCFESKVTIVHKGHCVIVQKLC